MKYILLSLLFFIAAPASAQTPGMAGVDEVRSCIMKNDAGYCHAYLTADSFALFDRFSGYKLMPCLPTDFRYESEEPAADHLMVKASMPAGGGNAYVVRLMFLGTPQGLKLDLPATLRRGLGEDWQSKLQLSEQLYLMMKQNMGDQLTCDTLSGLIKPRPPAPAAR